MGGKLKPHAFFPFLLAQNGCAKNINQCKNDCGYQCNDKKAAFGKLLDFVKSVQQVVSGHICCGNQLGCSHYIPLIDCRDAAYNLSFI